MIYSLGESLGSLDFLHKLFNRFYVKNNGLGNVSCSLFCYSLGLISILSVYDELWFFMHRTHSFSNLCIALALIASSLWRWDYLSYCLHDHIYVVHTLKIYDLLCIFNIGRICLFTLHNVQSSISSTTGWIGGQPLVQNKIHTSCG